MRLTLSMLPAALLLAAACQRTDRGTSTPGVSTLQTPPATPDAPLHDTRWALHRLAGQPLGDSLRRYQTNLQVTSAGTVQGRGGCNMFRGTLRPAVNDGELQFSPLATTRMACPALALESRYMQALQGTRAYRIQGDTLWLYGNAERTGSPLAQLIATRP